MPCLVKHPRVFCCKCDADAEFDLMEGSKKLGTYCQKCGDKALRKFVEQSAPRAAANEKEAPCPS